MSIQMDAIGVTVVLNKTAIVLKRTRMATYFVTRTSAQSGYTMGSVMETANASFLQVGLLKPLTAINLLQITETAINIIGGSFLIMDIPECSPLRWMCSVAENVLSKASLLGYSKVLSG
jgi:hypothetical protein